MGIPDLFPFLRRRVTHVGGPAAQRNDAPSVDAHENASGGRGYLALSLFITGAAVLFVYWQAWVSDDAYITFRQVANTLAGHGPVFNPGERVQAFTHPLWFIALLAGGWIVDLHAWSVLLSLALTLVTFLMLAYSTRVSAAWELRLLLVAGALLGSMSFVEFQTSGLETPLATMLLVILLGLLLAGRRPGPWLVLICALLVMTRPDYLFLVLPVCLLAVAPVAHPRGAGYWLRMAIALLPAVAWYGFALVYYGTPLPNSAYAKLAFPPGEAALRGYWYVLEYALHEPVHAALLIGALVGSFHVALRRIRRREDSGWVLLVIACGLTLHLAYVVLVGADFMRGRFILPALAGAIILGGEIAAPLLTSETAWRRVMAVLAPALPLAALLKIREYLPVGPLSGFASLRNQEWGLWLCVIATSVVVLVATVVAIRGRLRGRAVRGGSRLVPATLLCCWLCVIAMAGHRELHWGMALVFSLAVLVALAMLVQLVMSPARSPLLVCAPAAIILAAISSLCHIRPRSALLTESRGVAHEWTGYNTLWHESRFRPPENYPHYTMDQWVEIGRAARMYADRFGPIALMQDALGFCGWYAGPRVHLIDRFGLADAFIARCPADPASRVGHVDHFVPAAYLERLGVINLLPDWESRLLRQDPTLREDAERMKAAARWRDPQALQQWRRVQLVISGELFSAERLRALPAFVRGGREPGAGN